MMFTSLRKPSILRSKRKYSYALNAASKKKGGITIHTDKTQETPARRVIMRFCMSDVLILLQNNPCAIKY
jgi:chaperone required for assembly of F1-ATPase